MVDCSYAARSRLGVSNVLQEADSRVFEKVVGYGQAYRCIEEEVRLYSGQEGRMCVSNKIPIRISKQRERGAEADREDVRNLTTRADSFKSG